MVFPVFPNHMTTAMTSLQLALFWILPQMNNVAAYRINFILDQTQWVACLFNVHNCYIIGDNKLLNHWKTWYY